MDNIQTQTLPISAIQPNRGQVDGLPKNPRCIRNEKFAKLKKSLQDDPEFMQLREVVVYDNHGRGLVIIGGNMRYRALKELKVKSVPVKILPADTPVEKLRAFTLKDNSGFGEWDFDLLANEWELPEIDAADITIPNVVGGLSKGGDTSGKRVVMLREPSMRLLQGAFFIQFYNVVDDETEEAGVSLADFKTAGNVNRVASDLSQTIRELGIQSPKTAILTSPPRRHKDFNFATAVAKQAAEENGLNYIADAFECKNASRLNPQITLCKDIEAETIILFDDIITTGTTTKVCRSMISEGRNVLTIIAAGNR